MNKYDIHLSTGTKLTVETTALIEDFSAACAGAACAAEYSAVSNGPFMTLTDNEDNIVAVLSVPDVIAVQRSTEPAPAVSGKMIVDKDGDVWTEVRPDGYCESNSIWPLADIDRRHGPTRPFNLNDSLTS